MTQQADIAQQLADNIPPEDVVLPADTNVEAAVAAVEAVATPTSQPAAPAASPPATEAPAPEQAAAFELPAELVTSAPTPDAGAITDMERQELARLRQSDAEMAQFRWEQLQASDIAQRTREYESRNIDPDTAKYIAEEVRAERLRGEQELNNERIQGQIEVGRRNAAAYYGKQYGVSPTALAGFGNPKDMERYAQLLAYTGKIDKRVEKVEKAQVPEQHFDGGQASTGGPRNLDDQVARLADDKVDMDMTPEAQAALRQHLGIDG